MLEIEIDGKKLTVPDGSTIMDAANAVGTYIPHFCYHKKLSIAANCRMCLVQVEKAPKPLPACATPVTDGMKVFTHSDLALSAQKGVMEFLLINHPLDCPICDQGGECQLQDLAVGYGNMKSDYAEDKRVVSNKDLGPLIATDMTRCIHCTRCVRFTDEIAGKQELGQANRGEHAEIMPFIAKAVESEISGNVIDLCPVGALTSKPFRYSARSWELSRRKSVSPHDGLGSNLTVQVKGGRVMRVLPLENEQINECWLADRDRFSYEGLNSPERLTSPMLKQDGKWHEVDWAHALDYVAHGLKDIVQQHGPASVGVLATAHSTSEELHLLQKLARGLGVENIDYRARQSDFRASQLQAGALWLGQSVQDLAQSDVLLVVGSNLRKEQPLLTQRIRQASKKQMKVALLNPVGDEQHLPIAAQLVVRPDEMANGLRAILRSVQQTKGEAIADGADDEMTRAAAEAIAAQLCAGKQVSIVLGQLAQHNPDYAELHSLALQLGRLLGAKAGFLAASANSVGAELANFKPCDGAKNAAEMLESQLKAYVLLNTELDYDTYNPTLAKKNVQNAAMVVAMSAFKTQATEYADVLLPIAPFSETSGTFVSMEGRVQSFNGVVKPLAATRPAWKIIRVLANLLNVPGFDYNSSEEIRDEIFGADVAAKLSNELGSVIAKATRAPAGGLLRVGEVPLYQADAICRRAASLQKTADAGTPKLFVNKQTAAGLGARTGTMLRVDQGAQAVIVELAVDDVLPSGVARLAAAHPLTNVLGGMFDRINVAVA